MYKRINYAELNAKQKEIYNFQKISGVLADYGFNCIKLADDWMGADFLAYSSDNEKTLRVQLKGRLTISKKYIGKSLHIAFPVETAWCIVPHDELLSLVGEHTEWLRSKSWMDNGEYHAGTPNKTLNALLEPYTLNAT